MLRTRVALTSAMAIAEEGKYCASNYKPLKVVFASATGSVVTNPEGKAYLDFLSGYGAVNQGHRHPAVIKAAKKQLDKLTLSSRAFYSNNLGQYAKLVTKMFKYDKLLPMNTGAEAVETSLKLARYWAYTKKGVPQNQALIVCCKGNFHGRTLGCISMSDDPDSYGNYGPLLPGIIKVEYGDLAELTQVFNKHHARIAAFICEPIQGEAGVVIPPKGYLRGVRDLCTKYNALYIDDEVQSGIGRSGKLLAVEHEGVKPDVVLLAKALGGGVLPVSAVLCNAEHMVFQPGTHGSTFGGNPLANAVAMASLRALKNGRMVERAAISGKVLSEALNKLKLQFPKLIKDVRCRGLFAAVEMHHDVLHGKSAYELTYALKYRRVLSKVTHGHTIRLTPPLVIKRSELLRGIKALEQSLKVIDGLRRQEALQAKKLAETKAAVAEVLAAEKKAAAPAKPRAVVVVKKAAPAKPRAVVVVKKAAPAKPRTAVTKKM